MSYGNPLTNISDDAFATSSTTLNIIFIARAAFRQLPKALLQLQNLTSLSIRDTKIDFWDEETLKHIGLSLRFLHLVNVSLSSWPSWVSSFSSLTDISFRHNPLMFVPGDAFTSYEDTLQYLDLYCTGLTQIPPTVNLSRLTFLDLSFNNISEITSDRLSSSLQSLFLNSNNITKITDTSFPNNSLMKGLVLYDNPISTISLSAFKPLSHLSGLSLSLKPPSGTPDAVTSLTTLKDFTIISTYGHIPCVCPPSHIVRWYKSYNGTLDVDVSCADGEYLLDYTDYLSGYFCKKAVSTSGTTVKATKDNNSSACLGSWKPCMYLYMLGLLTSLINLL